jgi:hypothetical protein
MNGRLGVRQNRSECFGEDKNPENKARVFFSAAFTERAGVA